MPADAAPALTYREFVALKPCPEALKRVAALFGGPEGWGDRPVTAAEARAAGVEYDDLLWVVGAMSRHDADVARRLRLWGADCAARRLHIYEVRHPGDDRPREAIIAARRHARGEIDAAARAAADAAADAAARAARASARAAHDAAQSAGADGASCVSWLSRDAAAYAAEAASAVVAVSVAAAAAASADARYAAVAETGGAARWAAELDWQYGRLVQRLSNPEPDDWPLPDRSDALKETVHAPA